MKIHITFFLIILSSLHYICQAQDTELHLQLKGNNITETKIINDFVSKSYFSSYSELIKEIETIQKKLLENGYLDFDFENVLKSSDSIVKFHLNLNLKYDYIKIRYDSNLIPKKIIESVSDRIEKSCFIVNVSSLEHTLQLLTSYLVSQGKTFSSLSLKNIQKKRNEICATLTTSENKIRYINDIKIKGYEIFPKSYLKYYANLKKEKIFNKKEVLRKAVIIDNLNFVKNIKPPEILFENTATTLYLYLEKKQANSFDGFLGFSSDNQTGDLELNGTVNLDLINNLNFGERLNLIYKNDGSEQQRFEVTTELPYIFKSPIGVDATLQIFKKDSSFLITEQNMNINYLINDKNTATLGFETVNSTNLLDTPQAGLNIEDYTSYFFYVGFQYKKKQKSSLFPIKSRLKISTKFGSRKDQTQKIRQEKGSLGASHIFELNTRNSFYIANTTAIILSDNLFTNELFRFGGINSMRGFEENSINSSLYNILNTEYRYLLSSNLYFHTIIDYSYFEDATIKATDNLTSFGFGFGLNTQTGLFKIIFANGKSSDQNFKFSNTKVHLSLIAKF